MNEEYNILVLTENAKIKDYVFSSNKLKSIRGASYLLDDINIKKANEIFEKYSGEAKKIYFGGGNILALFKDIESANNFKDEIVSAYIIYANGSKVIASVIDSKTAGIDNLPELVKTAREDVQKQKMEWQNCDILPNAFVQTCELCDAQPAFMAYKDFEDEKFICKRCHQKIYRAKSERRPRVYENLKDKLPKGFKLPETLKDIAKDTEGNFIGFIYADGNRMGEFFKKLNEKSSLEEMGFEEKGFSEVSADKYIEIFGTISDAIDFATRTGIVNAVTKYIKYEDDKIYPVEFIMAAGDDLVAVVPGEKALLIAAEFAKEFEKNLLNKLNEIEFLKKFFGKTESEKSQVTNLDKYLITSGIGVVIAKPSYPISRLFTIAEELQKSAKKRSFKVFQSSNLSLSAIDFHILTNTLSDDIKKLRDDKKFRDKDGMTIRVLRPFLLTHRTEIKEEKEFKAFSFDDFIETVGIYQSCKIPNLKVRQLAEIIQLEKNEAILESLKLLSRLNNESRQIAGRRYKLFPWIQIEGSPLNELYTDIIDILETIKFVDEDDIRAYLSGSEPKEEQNG